MQALSWRRCSRRRARQPPPPAAQRAPPRGAPCPWLQPFVLAVQLTFKTEADRDEWLEHWRPLADWVRANESGTLWWVGRAARTAGGRGRAPMLLLLPARRAW